MIDRNTYSQNELRCELLFEELREKQGGIWHVSTPGTNQAIIFIEPEDFKFGVSCLALSKAETGVILIIDTVMSNHIHAMVAGNIEQCRRFTETFRKRLARYLKAKGRIVDLSTFSCNNPIEVTDLKMARNVIAYIARNGYVVNRNYHPFSYPWGSGAIFFNPYAQSIEGTPFNKITFDEKRHVTYSRIVEYPAEYSYRNGVILPNSYCDYKLGENLFQNAHQYFNLLTKNVESYKEIAESLCESIILTDDEVFSIASLLSDKKYQTRNLSQLSPTQRIEMAKTLHYEYHTPKSQLRRILKLSDPVLDSLWPLSSIGKNP